MQLVPRQQIMASADGTPLLLRFEPRRRPGRQTVLLGHAMTVHSGLLGTLTEQLAEAGCDVWAGDLRGHGQSVSARAPLAHLDPDTGWDRMIDDMAAFAGKAFSGVDPEDCVMFGGALSCQLMLSLLRRQPGCARHLVMAPPSPRRTGATRVAASFLKLRRLIRPIDSPDPQLKHHVYSFLKAGLPPGSADADVISAFPDVLAKVLDDPRGFPTPTTGYWLNVLPGMHRVWDEIQPGDLDPALRVLLVSSPNDPQLRGQAFAVQVQDWFASRGVEDCRYLDFPAARSNPMVDAAHLPLADGVLGWLRSARHGGAVPAAPPRSAAAAALSPYAPALEMFGLDETEASADLTGLIQLCYAALEDESRWIELIYRLCVMSERDGHTLEQIMEAIQPHWQRAYELRDELRKAAMQGVIYSDVIDRLDLGVGMIDGSGGLHHANAAFRRALGAVLSGTPASQDDGEGPPVAALGARLLAAQPNWPPADNRDSPVLWDGKVIGVTFVPASLRHRSGDTYGPLPRLIVLRGPGAGSGGGSGSGSGAGLGANGLDHRAGLLSLSFALTGQESQVALLVSDGLSTEEVAQRLSISEHTLRSHLKQVFSKMGVSSRTELAAQIMSSPLGWMTGPPSASPPALKSGHPSE